MNGSTASGHGGVAAGAARWAGRHQRSLLVLLVLLVGGGIAFGLRLPVALFPRIDFPRVVVTLDAGDRPAEEMAALLTYPVETALRAIPAVRSVRSTTSRGSADISVSFAWGTDMVAATLQAEATLAQVMPGLPAGTSTEIRRMDPTVFPVIAYSLTSPLRGGTALYDLAYYRLHGRNSRAWFDKDAGRDATYDHLYTPAETDELTRWIDELAKATRTLYVAANNHFRGQAVKIAVELAAWRDGGKVEVPQSMVDAYPELQNIARRSQGSLFGE